MIAKKYNLINNVIGWAVFLIALVTYWLTLEPTASYWDCGEFIIQADKREVGPPPGNPIFMLTARFFSNFAPDVQSVSLMVNAMSGLLSALTILLLFWTITHLVRRLVVRDSQREELSLAKYLVIMGSGVVGALAYCWSDTFWFSAVEGEVYAFSSFCTALVFWLILKWENHADSPHSDRYLVLVAYVIGVSVAVHLLNLLCIPAIVLVFAYRKWKDMDLVKSLLALLLSFAIIGLVLFGLVPGFIKVAQQFELLFVNRLHASFNTGALVYAVTAAALFLWAIFELRRQKSAVLIKVSYLFAVTCSGMLFMGGGWWLGWILTAVLALWLVSKYCRPVPVRVMSVIMWSMAVIFVGYSSYALILIRSSADTPMNQNSPDNVFDLASYLNREQYGENPLLYGETLYSSVQKKLEAVTNDTIQYTEDGRPIVVSIPHYTQVVEAGKPLYAKGVRGAEAESEYGFLTAGDLEKNSRLAGRGGDYYVKRDYKSEVKMNPELDMFFPRIYSRAHRDYYKQWVRLDTVPENLKELNAVDAVTGEKVPEIDLGGEPFMNQMTGIVNYPQKIGYKPTFSQNLSYFFNYQLVHMYMRYFMWNFAGRQNDILNQSGELDAGNWISGIPFIDNARLGDQSLLPDDLGKNNPGHNRYFMLPLLLGIAGLLWQAFAGKRGIEQFWVVFFLFFMTGIAIVLYLNQPPQQPRERDYAFAGSFYAWAIWIGMGVAALWQFISFLMGKKEKNPVEVPAAAGSAADAGELPEQHPGLVEQGGDNAILSRNAAIVALIIGLVIPVQMVSQTWDDHDRSGRYAARDFAVNYLESLEPNAIVFCNGDNDTFPLWYAQEVEGVRTDVKVVNLSYLASDWYVNQMASRSYEAAPVHFTARPEDVAYGRLDVTLPGSDRAPVDLLTSLKALYSGASRDNDYNYPMLAGSVVTVPVDKKAVMARGLVAPRDTSRIVSEIVIDLGAAPAIRKKGYISLGELMMLDIIATNAAEGWPRPVYWCSTVGDEYHLGMTGYLRSTGMTHQLVPTLQEGIPARTDRAYDVVTRKYRWGGADKGNPYFDETARRMLVSVQTSMLDVASELIYEGDVLLSEEKKAEADAKFRQALEVGDLMTSKLSDRVAPYSMSVALTVADMYVRLGERLGDARLKEKARGIILPLMKRMSQYLRYGAAMAVSFGNPNLTVESRLMPYQFYRFIELYLQAGGNSRDIENIVKTTGYTVDQLKRNYDSAYGGSYGDTVSQELTEADYVAELSGAAATVNRLAAMSATDYASAPSDDRYIDSIFYQAIEQYVAGGVSREAIMADPEIRKVDMNRSKRISDEFEAKHPSM